MNVYEYDGCTDLRITDISKGRAEVAVTNAATPSQTVYVQLPAAERVKAAQALAGDDYRVISTDSDGIDNQPPTYLLLDLWQAINGDPAYFDDWHTRHGSPATWGQLLHIVRRTFRPCLTIRALDGGDQL